MCVAHYGKLFNGLIYVHGNVKLEETPCAHHWRRCAIRLPSEFELKLEAMMVDMCRLFRVRISYIWEFDSVILLERYE